MSDEPQYSLKQVIGILVTAGSIIFSAGIAYKTFQDYDKRISSLEESRKGLWGAVSKLNH